jgi:excinuclease ABC subunit B
MSDIFKLHSPYSPAWDQWEAIGKLMASIDSGHQYQTLLWVTGSGKTFTMANIIARSQRPALILAHNKTLAAQLAQEFKEFFPENAVHYFVSYYDYYQPEAFVVKTGAYIEKEATINEEIDRLRHAATESLLTRRDVIIVASVSCIYGIGEADEYEKQCLRFRKWEDYQMEAMIASLVNLQFKRSTADFKPGMFHIMGDTIEIWPSSSEDFYRLEFFGDTLERITKAEYLTYVTLGEFEEAVIFPAKHFVTSKSIIDEVIPKIQEEMESQVAFFQSNGKLVEAERIKMRTEYDIEMLSEVGFVNGIENYSMYMSWRQVWDPPSTLLDFFPKDYLMMVDESHITIPQIGGMYAWDRARKENLVNYGFRLPSALENRPLQFAEFEKKSGQTLYVSATPAKYELELSGESVAEQVIRPTGLLDPEITIEDMEFMVDSLMRHIAAAKSRGERSIITAITKKSSEDLAEYLAGNGLKVRYLHSEIETLERLEILRDFRLWNIDVVVGVNLLREGLDLPETSFIGILDAEKIGFLRSKTSLLQIIGRAARNVNGHVVMYVHGNTKNIPPAPLVEGGARTPWEGSQHRGMEQRSENAQAPLDKGGARRAGGLLWKSTDTIQALYPHLHASQAMKDAIAETYRRREIQMAYNEKHGIIPKTILSKVKEIGIPSKKKDPWGGGHIANVEAYKKRLELEMDVAAANLDFERAAEIRDELFALKKKR